MKLPTAAEVPAEDAEMRATNYNMQVKLHYGTNGVQHNGWDGHHNNGLGQNAVTRQRLPRMEILERQAGVSDACLLEPLDEAHFLSNLRMRYEQDLIYTYIGNVVVSVNPYKRLPIYNRDVINSYRNRNIYELPPHIYAITDDAYRSMRDRNFNQCVIISGESGSGKTEASKVIMQYVAAVCGRGNEVDRVKDQLLQSNPVLEAFGNAKTHRNDNSSRFGKYMDMEFDFKGDPIGGVITNYLLEKSRVVQQQTDERTFHIFYQLLAGADTSFLKQLKLARNPELYRFLQNSKTFALDKDNFQTTSKALTVIGFQPDEVVSAFQIVAAVLKLGNIFFQHYSNIDGTDGCRLTDDTELSEVCELFGCDSETLKSALCARSVETRHELVKTDLSAGEANYARDALCKALYTRLFTWLINRINDSIKVRTKGKRKSIGVLDIYGFEIFQKNGFEQFIINYCNEKLQQIFIELTLRQEQEEYIREGIEWISVEYFNNAVICDLIEKPNMGMLAMLDEECLRPGDVTDLTLLAKLNQTCSKHEHYEARGCRKSQNDRSLPHDAFRLRHYAGEVTYNVDGFVDKNNDLLFRDLSRAMFNCDHPLLTLLFPEGDMIRKTGNPTRFSLRRPATAVSQFKASISDLMTNLQSKSPNYIRCIKPNEVKASSQFDVQLVTHQVRYLGLIENVRVKRAGYAFRQSYELFLRRFKMLAAETWPTWEGAASDGVQRVLRTAEVAEDACAFGKTKLFIRNPKTLFFLEDKRKHQLHYLATLLQKVWRGWHARQQYLRMRCAQVVIASYFKGFRERVKFKRIRWASVILCSMVRGWKARKLVKELKYRQRCTWAVGIINKVWLGYKVRRMYRRKFRTIAGPKIVCFMQNYLRRRFLLLLAAHLASDSPTDHRWPTSSILYTEANEQLRQLHHKCRCYKYRLKFDQSQRNKMREKVAASDLFKDRKMSYPSSVAHPFSGDYVNLRMHQKWRKLSTETNDQHLVFADIVQKVNRRNGKMVAHLFVLSTSAVVVLDQRTFGIKYRIPLQQIMNMSLSPYSDKLVVIHLKKLQENGDILTKKGDFIISSEHVLEIVAKTYLLIKNSTSNPPLVTIQQNFQTEMNGESVDMSFRLNVPEVPPGTIKILRKGKKLEILEP